MINSEQLQAAISAIEEKKGRETIILDLRGISQVTDYFLLVTGGSSTQVKAITDNLEEKLPQHGIPILRIEGLPVANWVLLDCGDLVIHVMQEEARRFYNLERLWGDAQVVHL
ncbi:MAG TPA: ribosome silencing factor [Desulfobacteria bacterium]|nr:ribosome silencing factor [Desulfobacteria bacterium]